MWGGMLFVLVLMLQSTPHDAATSCPLLPNPFPFSKDMILHEFNASTETLFLDLTDIVYKFCNDQIYNTSSTFDHFQLDLIQTQRKKVKECPTESVLSSDRKMSLQASVDLEANNVLTIFQYVQGRYFLRLKACETEGKPCEVVSCSEPIDLVPDVPQNLRVCENGPGEVSAFDLQDVSQVLDFHSCSVMINTFVPLCTAYQSYAKAKVFTVEIDSADEHCDLGVFLGDKPKDNTTIDVNFCNKSDHDLCNATIIGRRVQYGVLRHHLYDLSRNSSYCLFYQLDNPHCQPKGENSIPCFFHTQSVSCNQLEASPWSLVNEPMFIGIVTLTLVVSLGLLMWTVIQCSKKKPETPVQQPIKKPPRSLTEDDLEHISRLPSQEIVLVYFPDTKRFKELNRKFRNWLVTLDVNDVKDIYDEKCSEEVLKDPESWVRKTLGGPEKRIILVCSRLAYECLITVKKGIASPKFTESDPHFGLLTRSIQYLDREMKGNYRNLICVRYEDLKICNRQYSSEAFNIVPGTEYVLPQHLEDVYRWIHPRDPKPESWSETRYEVQELLLYMKKYRHHDDNMFTVTFSANGTANSPSDESADLT